MEDLNTNAVPDNDNSLKPVSKERNNITTKYFHKKFSEAFVTNGFNATKAYLAAKPHVSYDTANAEGSKALAKPSIQNAIQELLEANSLSVASAMSIHRRNMLQDKHLPTSQKAVETVYQLAGLLKDTGGNTINVGIKIEQ